MPAPRPTAPGGPPERPTEGVPGRRARPLPLVLAAAGVALEAVALLGFGAWLGYESAVGTPGDPAVAQGSTAYFVVLGLLVAGVAWGLSRRHGWSGGAAVFLQLLALPIAWYMAGAGLLVGAVPLALVALVALGCLLAPGTRVALGR